jgi:Uma2 family endonuclease
MSIAQQTTVRRLTADEAMRMVEAGILGEDEHVELLDGALVEMSPQGPEHSAAITILADRLRGAYAGRAHVREEKPLTTGRFSLPEPDVAVVRGQPGAFAHKHPTGADAVLVVELAWSSQREDRLKASTYAAGGVAVYWLVDLVARKLEVRTTPVDCSYEVARIFDASDVVELPESSERWLVSDLLL